MRRALQLAARGRTHPNPRVGAVLVQKGRIIGEGWHEGVGTPHAETTAFADSKRRNENTQGATLYVTLEPCSFWTRPDGTSRIPCAYRCIEAGIAQVFAALEDPDARVEGQGFAQLRAAGVAVTAGMCAAEAREQNKAYIRHRQTGLPYVLHKAAVTLDGKTAAPSGDSKWITGPESRAYVHELRNEVDALVTGVGTVLADNPQLTTRLVPTDANPIGNGHNPLRVIIDSALRTPPTSKVACAGTLFVGAAGRATTQNRAVLENTGAEVVTVRPEETGRVSVLELARLLADRGLLSVLLECGGTLAASFWQVGLVNRALFFVAPKVIGGATAPTALDGAGLSPVMAGATGLGPFTVRQFGPDVALQAEVQEGQRGDEKE